MKVAPLPATIYLISMAVAFAPSAGASDWPRWMGPDRNSQSKETGLLKEWPKGGPPLAWKATGIGEGMGGIAVAKHAAGRFDEAIHWSVEAQRLRPGFQGSRRMLCASLALAGRADEARALLGSLRRDQPGLSMSWLTANVPYQTSRLIERYQDGMWKAGLR